MRSFSKWVRGSPTLTVCVVLAAMCWAASACAADPVTLFVDDFEAGLDGWLTAGTPDWHEGMPSNGAHCVHLEKNESVSHAVATVGFQDITVGFLLGAENLDRPDERVEALWHDGVDWVVLAQISDGDPEEDGHLHGYEFALPASADDREDLAIGFKMTGRAGGESGYVDDIVVTGVRREVMLSITGRGGTVLVDGVPEDLPWSGTYEAGSLVTLEAVPDPCQTWVGWDGDVITDENPLVLVLDADTSLEAAFAGLEYAISVSVEGSGSVVVDGVEQPIPYTGSHGCGSAVILEGVAAEGWQFVGWTGSVESGENPLRILVDSDLEVSAVFGLVWHSLSITGSGGGIGVDGALHELPWSGIFEHGAEVVVEAIPADCMCFRGWSGDLAGCDNPATITMDRDMSISADVASIVIFSDVGCDHWASADMAACYYAGIVSGYPDGTYGPAVPITRDQMAVYICRALVGGDESVPTGPHVASFSDVSLEHWAFPYVEYAVARQVVQGYPDGEYKPTVQLDRGQMAVFLARAMAGSDAAVPDHGGPPSFPDVDTGFWAHRHIEYIAAEEVAGGYYDGLYHPENPVDRAQMAVFTCRAFDLPR
jgi:hypothetical protein